MKTLIVIASSLATVGTLMAMSTFEFRAPRPTGDTVRETAPRVIQSAPCPPTPTPDPGGNLKPRPVK